MSETKMKFGEWTFIVKDESKSRAKRLRIWQTVFFVLNFECFEGQFIMSIGGRYCRVKRKDNGVYYKVKREAVFTDKKIALLYLKMEEITASIGEF
jgi:hypothetical protein